MGGHAQCSPARQPGTVARVAAVEQPAFRSTFPLRVSEVILQVNDNQRQALRQCQILPLRYYGISSPTAR